MINDVNYTNTIEEWIISNLDGWRIKDPSGESDDGEINPFMTEEEIAEKANKIITSHECQLKYEETLDMAFLHTNRLDIDDLSPVEARVFIRAVCKWTASNLWNQYNIRVNNEDLEDTYVQSYGGLLYSSAMKMLNPFIIQHITGFHTLSDDDDDTDPIWW